MKFAPYLHTITCAFLHIVQLFTDYISTAAVYYEVGILIGVPKSHVFNLFLAGTVVSELLNFERINKSNIFTSAIKIVEMRFWS